MASHMKPHEKQSYYVCITGLKASASSKCESVLAVSKTKATNFVRINLHSSVKRLIHHIVICSVRTHSNLQSSDMLLKELNIQYMYTELDINAHRP